jgi:hypothetical protein
MLVVRDRDATRRDVKGPGLASRLLGFCGMADLASIRGALDDGLPSAARIFPAYPVAP